MLLGKNNGRQCERSQDDSCTVSNVFLSICKQDTSRIQWVEVTDLVGDVGGAVIVL